MINVLAPIIIVCVECNQRRYLDDCIYSKRIGFYVCKSCLDKQIFDPGFLELLIEVIDDEKSVGDQE